VEKWGVRGDLHLSPDPKDQPEGKQFQSDSDVEAAVRNWLKLNLSHATGV